jgi:drug/metabolite transporter (DMT)-like permease
MGEAAALGSAMLWATTSILFGTQTGRIPAAVISALRLLCGSALLCSLGVLLLATGAIEGVTLSRGAALALSGMLGVGLGDTLYIRGIRPLGVSRAFPMSMACFPLFTLLLAAAIVGEPVTGALVAGGALIITGVVLVAGRAGRDGETAGSPLVGVLCVLGAAALWALASVWLKEAGSGVAPVLVAAIRVPAAALVALTLARAAGQPLWPGRYSRRTLAALAFAGLAGTGLGSLLYVVSVQEAGAARSAVLSSTGPLFALPLAALILRERLTARVVAGTLLSVLGIWLVTLG